jgi:hypothetical protein
LKPHVHLRWQEDGATKSTVVTSGYELRLETKSIAGGVLSGTLDLKVTGEPPAELKGSFTATIK